MKSKEYFKVKQKFDELLNIEKHKYKDKILKQVLEGTRGSSYNCLKQLSMAPGEPQVTGFQLPQYVELGLTDQQSFEAIADFFATVSQEYSPLCIPALPPNVREHLQKDQSSGPLLTHQEVLSRIKKPKKT